jgi:hypothetical protein
MLLYLSLKIDPPSLALRSCRIRGHHENIIPQNRVSVETQIGDRIFRGIAEVSRTWWIDRSLAFVNDIPRLDLCPNLHRPEQHAEFSRLHAGSEFASATFSQRLLLCGGSNYGGRHGI